MISLNIFAEENLALDISFKFASLFFNQITLSNIT